MDTSIGTYDGLTEAMENTCLDEEHPEPEQLLFDRERTVVYQTPLWTASPNTYFAKTWVRSECAKENCPSSRENNFSELNDDRQADGARILNLHLGSSGRDKWVPWPKKCKLRDNFMSWTSSLLFALQHIYYLNMDNRDTSSLDQMKLYVIDTI